MRITDNYVFFWSGPFSQWTNSPFVDFEGGTYNCAEQYMMSQKALIFGDTKTYKQIMETSNPKEQKALGRKVKNFDPVMWDKVAMDVVEFANYLKFTQNVDLLELLVKYPTQTFVEASAYDKIWGIGLAVENDDVLDESKWRGSNYLGLCITKIRNMLLSNVSLTKLN